MVSGLLEMVSITNMPNIDILSRSSVFTVANFYLHHASHLKVISHIFVLPIAYGRIPLCLFWRIYLGGKPSLALNRTLTESKLEIVPVVV